MSNNKQTRQRMKLLQNLKTWQLVVLLVLMGFVAATFLRLNNIGMIERRAAVLTADSAGDNVITTDRLYDLQRYVSAHMNTDMGKGVYLEATYKRDVEAAYAVASSDANPNGNIYKKVQQVCMPQFSYWSLAYLQCTTDELAKYPSSGDLINDVKLPRADSYLHVYASPLWSSDFAGWSMVICVVILIMIIARLISVGILKLVLSRKYKSI